MSKAILRTKQLSKQFGKQKALDRVTLAIPGKLGIWPARSKRRGKIHVVKNHDGDFDTDCGQPVF